MRRIFCIFLSTILFLLFTILFTSNASANNKPAEFKTLLGRLLIGPSVVEGTFEGQPVLKVAVQNDNPCEYEELLFEIKFITDKSPDGEPKAIMATFVVRLLGIGQSIFAVSYFPVVSGGPWKVQEVLRISGSCPEEDAERLKIEEAQQEEKLKIEKAQQEEKLKIEKAQQEEKLKIEKAQQEEKHRKISAIQKKYKTIGFKGLHLGMTRDDLNLLIEDDNFDWKFAYSSSGNEEFIFLKCDSCNIGCVGKEETKSCYEVELGSVEFYNNNIIRIDIQSQSYSARDIDPYLKNWADFAKDGLSTKYGKPTRSPLPVERINIFSFKEHYYSPMYVWTKRSNEISVNITHSEYRYYVDILYDDNIGIQEKKKEKKRNRKIEF